MTNYNHLISGIQRLLTESRRQAARSVNAVLTATYWEVGRRIVEYEQKGKKRAEYGETLLKRLSGDLVNTFGKGFSADNLESMRRFYLCWPPAKISETLSRKSENFDSQPESDTASRKLTTSDLAKALALSWSHYVRLVKVLDERARAFYETEALRGGWSVRQLDRQIQSMFYERTALSRNKVATLTKGAIPKPEDVVSPEEEIKNPYVLEFLGLKDEYSESKMEEALIRHLETFLLELGGDFTFVARQKRLRVGSAWYRQEIKHTQKLLDERLALRRLQKGK